jgi:transcriptional regulator GlxA family with amidase domain
VAFVLYPGVSLLDVAAPLQVLAKVGRPLRVVLVGREAGPIATDAAVSLAASHDLDELVAADAVVVPGGGLGTVRAMVDATLLGALARATTRARVVAANGTGALLLAVTGALHDRRATTHWGYAPFLERLGARFDPASVVEDGPYLTASGGAAGLELALRLTERLVGSAVATRLRRSFDGPEPSAPPPTSPLTHLPRAEAIGRLASMRLILAERADLIDRLAL